MSERDELARTIGNALIDHMSDDGYASYGTSDLDATLDGEISLKIVAAAVLAAGFRKPRTVTTVEELDALPDGAIIREANGDPTRAVKRQDGKVWWIDGPHGMSASDLIPLPATVLHEPEATK
ncbi:hypothetical protein ACTAQI_20245 [Pseudarthrobacter sp. alpha12b]